MKKREQTSQSAAVSQGALMWHQSITHPVRNAPASCPQRVEVRRPAECPHCRSVTQPAENQNTSTRLPRRPSLISGQSESACRSRRCLAKMLIAKTPLSQPQEDNCTQTISVPFMEYQTLSVDTKNLRLISRLQAALIWTDLELSWNTSDYEYDEVILPVTKVWTPELHVTNGIKTSMKHSSQDLLVYSNGTVKHNVIINAEINCEVNLFNYPFAFDECPVAIQAWTNDGCGTDLNLGTLKMVDGTHGDWQTESADYQKQRDDRNYIMVSLSIKYLNPFITLMLPSILLILADMISFSLPLTGGERNSFKVTLVLSFTMFLIILNDMLPGDSKCSPVIRTHFCICLVLLVVSMLISLMLTRLAKDGTVIFCSCFRRSSSGKNADEAEGAEETKPDVSVVPLGDSEGQIELLRKVVSFLKSLQEKEQESERFEKLANTLDNVIFWLYLVLGSVYFIVMITVMVKYKCRVNHFDFWY
ncbi:5-hydroxytryptamine receptor 3A-like isoform X3 [Takifugu flavidus]|uniref:5-hydroxytryptamine receptor 3A-like isoform X3 n=1 Tax=Takifugu flavidus TaxID=433684 RepID=UPI0025440B10|nr:5-hydroxytryptamine receptor 3A-like isoform X3 [Takifugu flavidus]